MITKNGKELLNLENSVERLKELVEQHYAIDRVIADFGITMVNDPLTQSPEVLGLKGTKWGEAYPVGYSSPYDIWVWTRPNPNEENVARGGWLNIGPLAIPGPAGKDGVGERGEPGRTPEIYAGEYYTEVANPEPGDYFLDKDSGDLYKYTQFGGWGLPIANLKGAPGESIQGPPGQTAPIITLLGIVEGTDELPPAGPAYVGKGYIVSFESGIRTVYTVMEDEIGSGTYSWKIGGSISGYSVIEANGEVVSEWNADTKLDKVSTNVSGLFQAYAVDTAGQQTMIGINPQASDWTIARRYDGGRLRVATPVAANDATTKAYVDNGLAGKLDVRTNTSEYPQLYEKTEYGANKMRYLVSAWQDDPTLFNTTQFQYSAVQRDQYGCIQIAEPQKGIDAVNRNYAEANYSKKLYRHVIRTTGDGYDENGNNHYLNMVLEIISTQSTVLNRGYLPEEELLNLLAGTSAPVGYTTAQGTIDSEPIAYISISRADHMITVFNEWDEVITAFAPENGVCSDLVVAIG